MLTDQMDRFGAIVGLKALHNGPLVPRLAGSAFTVMTRPGDNLAVHKAIDMTAPGDVLVVDAGGYVDRAVMGEILYRYAISRGIAGFLIEGAVRDRHEISEGPVPVFARGHSPMGPYKDGPGHIGCPVAVGGAVVHPGDVVVGDADGLVVIPRLQAPAVLVGGMRAFEKEGPSLQVASAGTLDRSWLEGMDVEVVGADGQPT